MIAHCHGRICKIEEPSRAEEGDSVDGPLPAASCTKRVDGSPLFFFFQQKTAKNRSVEQWPQDRFFNASRG